MSQTRFLYSSYFPLLLAIALGISFLSKTNVVLGSPASNLDNALKKRDFLLDEAHDEFAPNTKIDFELPNKKVDQKVLDGIVSTLQEPETFKYAKRGDAFKALLGKYDKAITSVRGGAQSSKALGCYVGNFNIHYKSAYTGVSLTDVGYWAYDLHAFLQQNDGWYKRINGSRYIPYADKEKFARTWFTRLDKNFVTLSPGAQSEWLHDAIEDGMVVYWFYETQKHQPVFERQAMWITWEIRSCEKRN